MDADWSVEIGEDLPWIDVPWEGWTDLRDRSTAGESLSTLAEAVAYPELGALLLEINLGNSALMLTSKCDVFPVEADPWSLGLIDADQQAPLYGLGSYVDLCVTPSSVFSDFAWHQALARCVSAERLAPRRMPRASMEVVIRQASLFTKAGFGLTLYATGYGCEPAQAREAWAQALRVSASVTIEEITRRVSDQAPREQPGSA